LPRTGFIDVLEVLREAAWETLEEPGTLRFSEERETSGRECPVARVADVWATLGGTAPGVPTAVPTFPAAFATRVAPAAAAAALTPATVSRVPDDDPVDVPAVPAVPAVPLVFNQPAGATGSSGSRVPAPRPLFDPAGRASGKRSE
jgi:hypothetical protein